MLPSARLQGSLINFFTDYLPLPCLWVALDGPLESFALGPIPPRTNPIYFEGEFGRLEDRWRYNQRQMKRQGPLQPRPGTYLGMHDLFVPIAGKPGGPHQGYILFGSFRQVLPGRAELWSRWCKLRGAAGPEDASDFVAYVRTHLDVPVLEAPIVQSLSSTLMAVAKVLSGQGDADQALALLEKAKREVFGPRLPWRMWHYAEARRDRLHRGPFQGAELAPWDADEFKLKRSPDSAVALVLRDSSGDAAEALCQNARLHWECFKYCRDQGGQVAGRLDEGAFILCAGNRLEAREQALRASQALSKALGQRVVASYRSYPRQAVLVDRAIQEAELALRLGLARGQDLVEALPHDEASDQTASIGSLSERFALALAEGRRDELRLLREGLSSAALKASGGRTEILRVHLRWSLGPLLKLLSRRQDAEAQRALAAESDATLRSASNVSELLRAHALLCDELGLRYLAPAQGEVKVRLRRAAGQLLAQPEEAVSLDRLARESGLSKAHFSRLFKASTGLGFAKSRLEARLAKARRLLASSQLSITAVAAECGFKNSAHFSTVFRQREGQSPRAFRSKKRKDT